MTSEIDNEDEDIMTVQGNISPIHLLLSKRIKLLSAVRTSDIQILHKHTLLYILTTVQSKKQFI